MAQAAGQEMAQMRMALCVYMCTDARPWARTLRTCTPTPTHAHTSACLDVVRHAGQVGTEKGKSV